jgi:hypothetical protein
MNLSHDQVKRFWYLWKQVCLANAWTKDAGLSAADIDARRKAILRECGFASLTTVDRTAGFTKVKNKLLILIGTDLQAAQEDQDATANTSRNHRWVIEKEILPCLALYLEDVTGYVAGILADTLRHYKTDRPTRPPGLGDLTPAQMHRTLMTLSARLNAKRKSAGDTIHEMRTKAGVRCDCAGCVRGRAILQTISTTPKPVLVDEPF